MGSFVILGAGGHAASVADVIEASGATLLAVAGRATRAWSVPVLGSDAEACELAEAHGAALALGTGDNAVRLAILASLPPSARLTPVVSPLASVSRLASIGRAVSVHHHVHIGPDAEVGDGVVLNTGAIVEHDAVVGDGAHVAPQACLLGAARIGARTLVGSGARVLPGVVVGDNVQIGSGAVVTADVPDDCTVVGVPARPLGPTTPTES